MSKEYTSLGLMSGTSGDGVDCSIIKSDGKNKYRQILDKYYQYDSEIYKEIHYLKDQINSSIDLKRLKKEINELEKKITIFHAKSVNDFVKGYHIDLVGFHGQTIFHNVKEKLSIQIGNAELLSQLVKKNVVYNFRQNDLENGGQGAPLVPIFHKLLKEKFKFKLPVIILNLGGIANLTIIDTNDHIQSYDIGPGNCLIDLWIRNNSKDTFDENGEIAKSGKVNILILNQALENFQEVNKPKSFDVKDFDLSFVRGLSLADGAATLTEYTSEIIYKHLINISDDIKKNVILTGGGRKNKFLIKKIETKTNTSLKFIDNYGINGDFVESQAFAYLAIRSFLDLPISFPETTGCLKPCTGGKIIKI